MFKFNQKLTKLILLSNFMLITSQAGAAWTEAVMATYSGYNLHNNAASLLPDGNIRVTKPSLEVVSVDAGGNPTHHSINLYQYTLTAPDWKVAENTIKINSPDDANYAEGDIGTVLTDTDATGATHVVYIRNVGQGENAASYFNQIWYHTNKSGRWTGEMVMQEAEFPVTPLNKEIGLDPKLMAIDNQGNIHLAVVKESATAVGDVYRTKGEILYASNQQGKWQVETVDDRFRDVYASQLYSYAKLATPTSIAIDQQGHAHLSYLMSKEAALTYIVGWQKDILHYATNRLGKWQTQSVDSGSLNGGVNNRHDKNFDSLPIIALDSQDKVHLLYSMLNEDRSGQRSTTLVHATNIGVVWDKSVIDNSKSNLMSLSSFIIQDDELHAIYQKGLELIYASKKPKEKWNQEVLKTTTGFAGSKTFSAGSGSDLAASRLLLLDKQNVIHTFSSYTLPVDEKDPFPNDFITSMVHSYMQ